MSPNDVASLDHPEDFPLIYEDHTAASEQGRRKVVGAHHRVT
jgi:hypothetical protein